MAVIATFTKDPDAVLDFTIRWGAGDWAGSTAYDVDEYVRDDVDGKFYKCVKKHTSDATLRSTDAASWEVVKDGLWVQSGDAIATSTWVVDAGITKDSDSKDAYSTTIWLSGGTVGTSYEITNRVTTTNSPSRSDDRTIKIRIKEQ